MSPSSPTHAHKARYPGEDTSPTTSRELRGFYAYSAAAEVFVICGVGSFLPVLVEQLARENGVLREDRSTPCVQQSEDVSRSVRAETSSSGPSGGQCVVAPFGVQIATSSFALYTFSCAILVQVGVLVSMGALADYGSNRKKLLMGLGITGSACCAALLFVPPAFYLLAPLLIIISVTCLGSSFVLLNAYLPIYAKYAPREHIDDEGVAVPMASLSGQPTSRVSESEPDDDSPRSSNVDLTELETSTEISARGYGIGYSAALMVQVLCIGFLVLIAKLSSTLASGTLALRIVLFGIGLWWLTFTLISSRWLKPRPGPPLPSAFTLRSSRSTVLTYLAFSWKSMYHTIKVALRLRQMLKFLLAWFFLSDALATVADTAILFGKTELDMSTPAVAVIALLATGSAVLGALLWPRIQSRYSWRSKSVILICILLFLLIPLNGLLGFLPFIKHLGIGGIQSAPEIYFMAMIHGIAMGGLSAYCRSFYGNLVPPGSEAAFYALFAFTDKGSSIFGPAIVGSIADRTGSLRGGFAFCAVLIAVPVPFVAWVHEERGRADAVALAEGLDRRGARRIHEQGERTQEEAEGLLVEERFN